MAEKRSSFSGKLGFVLASAGSAVGLGNIWRFPYLAAKYGGGIFLLVYLILAVTFGFALMTAETAIGRRTGKSSLHAFGEVSKKWKFIGPLTFIVPAIILTYYCAIGGWVLKYITVYFTGASSQAADSNYFGAFISSYAAPIVMMLIYLSITAIIVYNGVEKGVEEKEKCLYKCL